LTEFTNATVRVLGTQYLVVIDGHSHVVGKDKRCHTCRNNGEPCPAVHAVARYLKAGGRRAPDTLPAPPRSAPKMLPVCPICGAEVERDVVLDDARRGPGWRCTEGGYEHLFLHRYSHLKAWFCGEGAKRHAMFLPDEPLAVQIRPPEFNIIPFVELTSRKQETSGTQHKQVA
jgi:hypothetical protein